MVLVICQEQFDVLKITNVPFPSSSVFAVSLNATHDKDIVEFTVCYRIQITSYNDGWLGILHANKGYMEAFGYKTGIEFEGYQSTHFEISRKIPGGGLGGRALPVYHNPLLPRFIQTGKWHKSCASYSSKLHKFHVYQDGLKAFSYNFKDENENPLPATFFDSVRLGQNMRGLLTDLNIFSTFFEAEEMVSWTVSCKHRRGEIFSWDVGKLNTSLEEGKTLKKEFIKLDKTDVCLDPNIDLIRQEPSKLGAKSEQKRFKPKLKGSSSYIGKVLEVIADPDHKSALDCMDRCYRLAGQILTIPQSEEEERLLDKTMWNYMMKRANNNITFLNENKKITEVFVGGQSRLSDLEETITNVYSELKQKKGVYPKTGYFKFYHPVTGEVMKPSEALSPHTNVEMSPVEQCSVCMSSLKDPIPGHLFFSRSGPQCLHNSCPGTRASNFICVFPKQPLFNLRGLCKDAVMDTQYKFAEHSSKDLNPAKYTWGDDVTRSYVGPKGWVIARDKGDKRWRMTHPHYPDKSLTMLDNDVLPLGRHNWRVANDACSGGETVSKVLLLSGCHEAEFTCDDGKCLDMAQRCNNIEVAELSTNIFFYILFVGLR